MVLACRGVPRPSRVGTVLVSGTAPPLGTVTNSVREGVTKSVRLTENVMCRNAQEADTSGHETTAVSLARALQPVGSVAPAYANSGYGLRGTDWQMIVNLTPEQLAAMTPEQLKAALAEQLAENAKLREQTKAPAAGTITAKVTAFRAPGVAPDGSRDKGSDGGLISLYGLGRFPVTLAASQWARVRNVLSDPRFTAWLDAQADAGRLSTGKGEPPKVKSTADDQPSISFTAAAPEPATAPPAAPAADAPRLVTGKGRK